MSTNFTGTAALAQGEAPPGDGASSGLPGLVLLYAPTFEQLSPAYVFGSPELTIGRDASNAICVPDPAVRRQHARISARAGRWWIEDLGDPSGTIVGGVYVGDVALAPHDEIRIGDAIFKFVEAGAERCVRYRIDGRVAGERRPERLTGLVGGAVIEELAAAALRLATADGLVTIVAGERGTGKALVARALLALGRSAGPLVRIACAELSGEGLEAALFGAPGGGPPPSERPALAHLEAGGAVLLDDLGALPLAVQARLARALDALEGSGGADASARALRPRLVCTARSKGALERGEIHDDLLARAAGRLLHLPPLRAHKEDVALLARGAAERLGRRDVRFTVSFMVALLHYDWPGNVRELERCVEEAITRAEGAALDSVHLPAAIGAHMVGYGERARPSARAEAQPLEAPPEPGGPSRRAAPTEPELRALLERHAGNVAAVGRELGKERMQIHRWLKRYGIDLTAYR